MARVAELQYQATKGDVNEVLFRCEEGIPLLWMLCFGTRNNWIPGESVEVRGAAASRNRFETSVEDALYRLEQGEDSMHTTPRLWPWYSAVQILRRRLNSRPKSGLLRLAVPWATQDPRQAEALRSAISFVENAINFVAAGQPGRARVALGHLEDFSPIVFRGDSGDEERLDKCRMFAGYPDIGMRVALLTLGNPSKDADAFERQAKEFVEPLIVEMRALPPAPDPEPEVVMEVAPEPEPSGKRGSRDSKMLKKPDVGPPTNSVQRSGTKSIPKPFQKPRTQTSGAGSSTSIPKPSKEVLKPVAAPAPKTLVQRISGLFRRKV